MQCIFKRNSKYNVSKSSHALGSKFQIFTPRVKYQWQTKNNNTEFVTIYYTRSTACRYVNTKTYTFYISN